MSAHVPVTAEELAEIARNFEITNGGQNDVGSGAYELAKVRLALVAPRLAHDLAERTAERDAFAATVERLIREAGAIRLDERQRAEAEHRALADEGRQRDANRIERLEGEIARLRVLVNDADRAKAEHAATRDELKKLHDVLSGKRGAP